MRTVVAITSTDLADVAIVGGGAAGLAAALQLTRARRSVVVIDAGEPRNAPAAHMHAYLGSDGLPPGELLARGRDEVQGYGGRIVAGTVTTVTGGEGQLRVHLAGGDAVDARRVLVAAGLVDELPQIAGVAERWGRDVLHCPYCHGWEVRDQRIVVIATGPMAAHQALLFRQLSDDVVVVVHGGAGPEGDDLRRLLARRVRIVDGPVTELVLDEGLRGVRLADGRVLDADAVVVQPRFVARSEVLADLGVRVVPTPMGTGEVIETDARGATSVPGVYAAGNVSDVSAQVLQAAAEGSRVGAVINADLAVEDAERAVAALAGDTAEHWDHRYADVGDRMWSGRPNSALVAEVADLEPGTALDVGCGEGADAIWLAEQGWRVTAVDISSVAVERGRQGAEQAGVQVEWVALDILREPLPAAGYDLVSAQYPAFRHDADDTAIRALVDAVAPGGTLLVVHHAFDGEHRPHGFDPGDYVQPDDVARCLGEGWTIEVHERRSRVRPPGSPGPDVPDAVLRARRST
jgi:thioredoxin reductase